MENQNEKLDAIQKKLRKLQKMYEGAKAINSEGEAAAAAAAIQRILTEYNLTIDEVGVESERSEVIQQEESGNVFDSIGGQWEQKLYSVLCKYNFCRCFIYGASYKRLMLIGTKENLEMVHWLKEVLASKYVELSAKAYKEYKKSAQYACNPIRRHKYQRSFLIGCASGLDKKLFDERERDKKDEEIGSRVCALVVKHDAALDNYVKRTWGKTGFSHRSSGQWDAARSAGYEAGRNTSVGKPISCTRSAAAGVKMLGQ